ncbi:efflux RND transporter periplasmic adaptor subunit [Roseateles microcysteis]|uniref:efflux RND transporter periplasmic adaptor subunit n=1 Tax=Roseateles microcysteis TaxID=3119057 RepID=UPI002FE57D5F
MSASPLPQTPNSGAAMDRQRPAKPRWPRRAVIGAGAAALLGLLLWQAPSLLSLGAPVRLSDVDLSTVAAGQFRDDLVSRATVAPLQSVLLDSVEDGRVEAVLVHDGAAVTRGQLMFRLSSPQREQELLARSSEVAQQLANLSSLRSQWVAAQAAQRRALTQAEFELATARRNNSRTVELAKSGFISPSALQDSIELLAQQQRLLDQLRADGAAELATREQSLREMERAVQGLEKRLQSQRASTDALSVRAPADGRLTGFSLQVGETVRPGAHLGRIDSAAQFKLVTKVDEFHLGRVATGQRATAEIGGQRHQLSVARIDPQVKEGRFSVELAFDAAPPALQVGQSLDCRLTLGAASAALLLGEGPFLADSGGAWVFVLDASGREAQRRKVRLGRRAAGLIEVLDGLQPGERVITSSYRPFLQAASLRLQP